MTKFTDIFIQRPVLATVISLLILFVGLRALFDMPLRQFPEMKNTVITVSTAYPGASAELIQGFITTPLEKSNAGADGIDYITATSNESISSIKAHIKLNYDPGQAFTNIMSKVAEVRGKLPRASEQPIVNKETGDQIALMYISFNSTEMAAEQITDYITRVVQPQLETIVGVAKAEIFGNSTFAMRIWLNPEKMGGLQVTAEDITNALREKNFLSAAGQVKGKYVLFNVGAETDLHSVAEFENIVIKSNDNTLVRLKEVAKVELGAKNYDSSVVFNGKKAIFVGITATPAANPLTVISKVREKFPDLQKDYPPSLESKIVYDATKYIRASIDEVITTIIEATLIVIIVIFLFLGSMRTVLIPMVTIPLSLIGVCTLMLALGYSINLLTLLAMVLAIGLVVDDAIVVVENTHRHIEAGMSPFQAALKGAREIAMPIIAMTITLAVVYAPIGFMGGVTGALFKEFAFTLASAVLISGVVALTLSPMMCSKLLNKEMTKHRFVHFLDECFEKLKIVYQTRLHNSLDFRPVTLLFTAVVIVSCYFLYTNTQKELAPTEDKSVLFISATAPRYANLDYVTKYTEQFSKIFTSFPAAQDYFIVNGMGSVNNVIAGLILKPWDERDISQNGLMPQVQNKLDKVAGLKTAVFPLPPLPGSGGLPIEFIITSTSSHELIYQVTQKLQAAAQKSGLFMFVDSSLKFNNPKIRVKIDRDKAASLGISMQAIGDTLATALGGNYVNRFSMDGRSYEVIPQLTRKFQNNPNQINRIYLKTAAGEAVPLATVISLDQTVQPNSLSQFQLLNSATIQGMMMPGKTEAEGLAFLQQQAKNILPKGVSYDYGGQLRRFVYEGKAIMYTFFFAVVIILLVLAAQFESFRSSLIILFSAIMAICGALIPLNLGAATLNIYTEVGLLTLIGLISKHGILMVDFANKLQLEEELSVREAIEKAAGIRLRPILMTTAAMVAGVTPLLFASGAGAVSRRGIGIVIASGMSIGTLFTLFVVPMMYTFLAKKAQKPNH